MVPHDKGAEVKANESHVRWCELLGILMLTEELTGHVAGRCACDPVHTGPERRVAQGCLLSLRGDHLMQLPVEGRVLCRRCFSSFHMLM